MIERVIILDAVDPVAFYGVNNANVQLIKNLFPESAYCRPRECDEGDRR